MLCLSYSLFRHHQLGCLERHLIKVYNAGALSPRIGGIQLGVGTAIRQSRVGASEEDIVADKLASQCGGRVRETRDEELPRTIVHKAVIGRRICCCKITPTPVPPLYLKVSRNPKP